MKTRQNLPDNPIVGCSCGRRVNADMMRDVRSVKLVLGIEQDDVCDSCMEHFYRTDKLTRENYYRAAGAPPALVAKAARRDQAIRAARGKQA